LIGAPDGQERLTCAELAIFREIQKEELGKIVYIAPSEGLTQTVFTNWKHRMGNKIGLNVEQLTGTV